jgi:hypothetical protein
MQQSAGAVRASFACSQIAGFPNPLATEHQQGTVSGCVDGDITGNAVIGRNWGARGSGPECEQLDLSTGGGAADGLQRQGFFESDPWRLREDVQVCLQQIVAEPCVVTAGWFGEQYCAACGRSGESCCCASGAG